MEFYILEEKVKLYLTKEESFSYCLIPMHGLNQGPCVFFVKLLKYWLLCGMIVALQLAKL